MIESYGALLDSAGINVCRCLLDENMTFLEANENFYKSAGYNEAEYRVLFPNIRSCYKGYEIEFQKIKSAFDDVVANGGSHVKIDCRRPLRDGSCAWINIDGMITGEKIDGAVVLMAAYSDISSLIDLKVERDRLKEEKNRYFEWMMNEYMGNIYISDIETYEILFLNKAACTTLQASQGELLGKKCYEVLQGRTSPCPFCNNAMLTEEEVYSWEFANPKLNKKFLIKDRIINWQGRRSRIELWYDILSSEYKLGKNSMEWSASLNAIPGGLVRVDARDYDTILWYGGNFLEVLGYTEEQFKNELHSKCGHIHPEDRERALSLMQTINNTGDYIIDEFRFVTRSGETKILTVTCYYVSGADSWDGIPSIYSMGIDITKYRMEQERQRKALEEAYQSLHVANLAKSNFLSAMSHDIRTPMNAIIGMTAIANANLDTPAKISSCLEKINISGKHLLNLINEVLDMSKIESGKVDLVLEEVGLPDVVDNIVSMCRPLIEEKKQHFKVNIVNVRNENVIIDVARLQQVFMNLLSNAVKYTSAGGSIKLTINELHSEIPGKGNYEFIFEDNGIGMSQEYMQHIFEPFSRADDPNVSRLQGTGLGLAIAHNIVNMMNGTIEVRSELGQGSIFTVTVPLDLYQKEDVGHDKLLGLPVLVVDDDQAVCESATMLLQELGMRGSWVLSGEEAVVRVCDAHIQQDDFYAVILDWKMPGMGGLETVRAIRERVGTDVPIIIISAYDYSDIEKEFLDAGANAFINKPLFKSKMLHVLQLFCDSCKADETKKPEGKRYADLSGRRVLLVEDNELNREIAVELLQMYGIAVEEAENGKIAVERFEKSAPGYYDAILMDIQMPVMDGYQATQAIRSLRSADAGSIPILALTANAFATDAGKAKNAGMNEHITKPINLDILFTALLKWIV